MQVQDQAQDRQSELYYECSYSTVVPSLFEWLKIIMVCKVYFLESFLSNYSQADCPAKHTGWAWDCQLVPWLTKVYVGISVDLFPYFCSVIFCLWFLLALLPAVTVDVSWHLHLHPAVSDWTHEFWVHQKVDEYLKREEKNLLQKNYSCPFNVRGCWDHLDIFWEEQLQKVDSFLHSDPSCI